MPCLASFSGVFLKIWAAEGGLGLLERLAVGPLFLPFEDYLRGSAGERGALSMPPERRVILGLLGEEIYSLGLPRGFGEGLPFALGGILA